ncbi:MAG: hypothetical protein JST93_14465, partial [Acidobacteria bacterium]|nr:hypothetical protein [Acidobacteriota bacterium]
AEIEMASQVNNADAVADLKAVLDGVEQAITEAEDTIANTKCPSPERTVYEFPATVSELKAYQGEPTKPKPSAKG